MFLLAYLNNALIISFYISRSAQLSMNIRMSEQESIKSLILKMSMHLLGISIQH